MVSLFPNACLVLSNCLLTSAELASATLPKYSLLGALLRGNAMLKYAPQRRPPAIQRLATDNEQPSLLSTRFPLHTNNFPHSSSALKKHTSSPATPFVTSNRDGPFAHTVNKHQNYSSDSPVYIYSSETSSFTASLEYRKEKTDPAHP